MSDRPAGTEALCREILASHPDAVRAVDDAGRIVCANPAAARMFQGGETLIATAMLATLPAAR